MEKFTKNLLIVLALVTSLGFIVTPVIGQSSSVCTGAMIRNFTPCIGFLAGGSKSSPSSACCGSLKDLMRNGQDCLCLIVTGGVPFQVPTSRTLSLPRACKMSGVPIECRATSTPIPSPDPETPGLGRPNMSPRLSPPSPRAQFVPQPFTPPSFTPAGGDTTPPSTPQGDLVPTLMPPGMRPTLTSTASQPSHNAFKSIIVAVLGVILLKCY